MDGSYKLESFTDNIESEINRLKYQVDLFYKKEIELYKKIGLRDGMTLIECGSGPGFLVGNIIRDLPGCSVTALEIDPRFVEILNKNSVKKNKKLFEVKQASIYETELPENYFDFAISRLVMEHLNKPEKAIAELRRILKPGGKLVLVSNDFAYHLLTYPPVPELDEMYKGYINSRISEGGNPLIGRQLPVLLKKGLFEAIEIEIICVHSEIEGDKPFLKAENVNISKSLVKDSFLEKEILESLIEKWYEMLQRPDHVLFRQLFVISGIKGEKTSVQFENNTENESVRQTNHSLNISKLRGMTSGEQISKLGSFLARKVQAVMELENTKFDLSVKLNYIDIDSIAAAELSAIVKSDFKTDISISDILQNFSVNDIIKLILKNVKSFPSDKTDGIDAEAGSTWLEGEL